DPTTSNGLMHIFEAEKPSPLFLRNTEMAFLIMRLSVCCKQKSRSQTCAVQRDFFALLMKRDLIKNFYAFLNQRTLSGFCF
ncbi:hypothetical protein HMPREF9443_01774, partial [Phascolarctobacterium succinatutens YIT 12067]